MPPEKIGGPALDGPRLHRLAHRVRRAARPDRVERRPDRYVDDALGLQQRTDSTAASGGGALGRGLTCCRKTADTAPSARPTTQAENRRAGGSGPQDRLDPLGVGVPGRIEAVRRAGRQPEEAATRPSGAQRVADGDDGPAMTMGGGRRDGVGSGPDRLLAARPRPAGPMASPTIPADSSTSGSPPPGCADPPTRYTPGTGATFAGRRNAARGPCGAVPSRSRRRACRSAARGRRASARAASPAAGGPRARARMGAKAVSIYRDGSKRTQPLNTSRDKDESRGRS